MTHDFEEENRLFQSGYVKGYHDAVLKAQEPRVLTLDNLEEDEPYWLEQRRLFGEYVLLNHIEQDAKVPYAFFVRSYGHISFEVESYGKTWRCWSSRPTKKQMEVMPWMD